MKNILVILLFFFCMYPCTTYAQVVRINNGISITSLRDGKTDFFRNYITSCNVSFGMDYIQDKRWNLSSEISCITIGGLEKDLLVVEGLENINAKRARIKEKNEYIQFNTTFRIKTSKKYQSAYLGIGPSVSLSIGDGKFKSIYFPDYRINKFLYGLKSEAGINARLANKLYAGINAACFYYFKEFARSDFDKLKCNVFTLTLLIGYEF